MNDFLGVALSHEQTNKNLLLEGNLNISTFRLFFLRITWQHWKCSKQILVTVRSALSAWRIDDGWSFHRGSDITASSIPDLAIAPAKSGASMRCFPSIPSGLCLRCACQPWLLAESTRQCLKGMEAFLSTQIHMLQCLYYLSQTSISYIFKDIIDTPYIIYYSLYKYI